MSLVLVNGHMGIVQLLQEFELLRAGPCTSDGLTLGDGVQQGPSVLDKPTDKEVCSRWDSEDYQGTEEWLAGDVMKDVGIGCANDEGADVNRTHGEPSGSRRDAKRLRVNEDGDSQGAVHDMVDPASKRRRGAAAVAGDP
ncbi:hypothetical protein BKA70DRAFT_1238179 [Coprinopsis sp. MPI-PUGE-AT-0042]|nr:hypothetical protein BKA70DRAFT_1238179 [Coprinopsis sp. MPI-PUGE-AT-0042]